MRLGRGPALLASVLLIGCQVSSSMDSCPPESLGALPDDLPLPPGFRVDFERGQSNVDTVKRTCEIFLAGSLGPEEVTHFFKDHLRLARWKPDASGTREGKTLAFRKGDERVFVTIERDAEGVCRVHVALNPGGSGGDHP